MLDRSSIACFAYSMNKLSIEERKQIVAALTEGNSLRSITRMTGVHRTTVMKLLCDLGRACSEYQDKAFAISAASASSAMKSGHSFTRKKRTAPASTRRKALAIFGQGLRSTLIQNSFHAGLSANVTRVAHIISFLICRNVWHIVCNSRRMDTALTCTRSIKFSERKLIMRSFKRFTALRGMVRKCATAPPSAWALVGR